MFRVECPNCLKKIVLENKGSMSKHLDKCNGAKFTCPHCPLRNTAQIFPDEKINSETLEMLCSFIHVCQLVFKILESL